MHTLLEQSTEAWEGTDFTENFNHLLTDVLGYTKSGDYYYSPIDNNFGIRFNASNSTLYITFDKNATVFQLDAMSFYKDFHYHISSSEKTVYMRLQKDFNGKFYDFIISHDDSGNTVVFHSNLTAATSGSNISYSVKMLDKTNTDYLYDEPKSVNNKVTANLPNAIARVPSLNNNCLMSELYSVIKVQSYPSATNTYINFNGQIYRIVGCAAMYSAPSDIPYFAFPVSDT